MLFIFDFHIVFKCSIGNVLLVCICKYVNKTVVIKVEIQVLSESVRIWTFLNIYNVFYNAYVVQ